MYTTMKEILEIEKIVATKMDRLSALERMVTDIRSRYHDMTDKELESAVKVVAEIHRDIAGDKEWIKKANKTVADFFSPAQKEE